MRPFRFGFALVRMVKVDGVVGPKTVLYPQIEYPTKTIGMYVFNYLGLSRK